MEKELYIVEHCLYNDGQYEDHWETTETFGVFETFADARDAIQHVVDKHKFMSDNKVENYHGDVCEFCEYEERYVEYENSFRITWRMNAGYYMSNYTHIFDIKEIEIGNYDPDIDPGY